MRSQERHRLRRETARRSARLAVGRERCSKDRLLGIRGPHHHLKPRLAGSAPSCRSARPVRSRALRYRPFGAARRGGKNNHSGNGNRGPQHAQHYGGWRSGFRSCPALPLDVPELPEVETVRRTLLPRILGSRILTARLLRRDVLIAPGDPAGGFSRQRTGRGTPPAAIAPSDLLEDCTITEILRRGKQLAIIGQPDRDGPRALTVQLGMSGQLFIEPSAASDSPLPTHVHALWTFHDALRGPNPKRAKDTAQLCFRDPRRFGGLRVLRSMEELNAHWLQLGPDALDLSAEDLLNASRDSSRAIKALLMDQATVAGIGNIYADEALFRAGIRPSRPARRLKPVEAIVLSEAIRAILHDAIEARGSTLRDYRDADGREGDYQGRHAVYGRAGENCRRCGRVLRSGILAQRTTVWCPACQR